MPSPIAEATDVRKLIIEGWGQHEETDTPSSVSCRRGTISLSSEPFDEKRPVGLLDSSESVHLTTYVAAFALDTLPRQISSSGYPTCIFHV